MNRSWRLPVRQALRERANPTLKWIFAGATAMVILLLTVPALRDAFTFGPLQPADWLIALAGGCAAISWFELLKLRSARARRGGATE